MDIKDIYRKSKQWSLQTKISLLVTTIGIIIPMVIEIIPNSSPIVEIQNNAQINSSIQTVNQNGDNYLVDAPTTFKVDDKQDDIMEDGKYQLKFMLRAAGVHIVPALRIEVVSGNEYLAHGTSNGVDDPGWPAIRIDPKPSWVSNSQNANGVEYYNMPAKDYSVTITFNSKPPLAPKLLISPLEQ